jgi:hypothetical protein
MDENFIVLIVPSNLNRDAPTDESLVLLFTVDEMEQARRRGEIMLRNRMRKGVDRDAVIRQCLNVS